MKPELFAEPPGRRVAEAAGRFTSVKRWHMVETTRTQTLAEHSAAVAILVYSAARTAPLMYFGPACTVVHHALFHDLPEVFTGDIPTPVKPYLQGLDELEELVTPEVFKFGAPSDDIALLIKLCDLADGLRFMKRHGVGGTAQFAIDGLSKQFYDKLEVAYAAWPKNVCFEVRILLQAYIEQ